MYFLSYLLISLFYLSIIIRFYTIIYTRRLKELYNKLDIIEILIIFFIFVCIILIIWYIIKNIDIYIYILKSLIYILGENNNSGSNNGNNNEQGPNQENPNGGGPNGGGPSNSGFNGESNRQQRNRNRDRDRGETTEYNTESDSYESKVNEYNLNELNIHKTNLKNSENILNETMEKMLTREGDQNDHFKVIDKIMDEWNLVRQDLQEKTFEDYKAKGEYLQLAIEHSQDMIEKIIAKREENILNNGYFSDTDYEGSASNNDPDN